MSLKGCYSIAEDGTKHYGEIIFQSSLDYNYTELYYSVMWKKISFSLLADMGDCNMICNNFMKCSEMFGEKKPILFSELFTITNILILVFFVIMILTIFWNCQKAMN